MSIKEQHQRSIKFLVLVTITLTVNASTQQLRVKVYSKEYAGTDVIDLDTQPLTYASNLVYSPSPTDPTLFFTSYRGQNNLKYAQFDPNGSVGQPNTFWLYPQSPLDYPPVVAQPFMTLASHGNNIIGASYPPVNSTGVPNYQIQSIYLDINNPTSSVVTQTAYPLLSLISFLIDPHPDATGKTFVYAIGWYKEGLSVARGTIFLNNTGSPIFQISDLDTDVAPILNGMCYDVFDDTTQPKLWLTPSYLLVAIPGRCAYFAKFTLPPNPAPWRSASIQSFDPTDTDDKYISSVDFDPDAQTLHYIFKSYSTLEGTLQSFSVDSWKLGNLAMQLLIDEGKFLMVVAKEEVNGVTETYLYIAETSSNLIDRVNVTATAYLIHSTAIIDNTIDDISSMVYVRPFLYYTTYEPDSKLIRIPKSSFCRDFCRSTGFCNNGVCTCRPGYIIDPTNTTAGCTATTYVSIEIQQRELQGAAAALGVLFAFSLVAAIAGWYMYFRAKSSGGLYNEL